LVWPGLEARTKVRLRGIDAPELNARCPAELAQAEAARDALARLLASGAVEVSAVSFDKYGGRVVAQASSRGVPDIGAELLTAGLVRHYGRGKRQGWC
jgi:endonuclease YncB( thermonuclease family)